MNNQSVEQKDKTEVKKDEKILVVERYVLFSEQAVQGFLPISNFSEYEKIVRNNQKFLWRSAMEHDPTYKQIIPYLVFNYADKYFVMQRKSTASEERLKNKYSLGIGGHIREEDLQGKSLADWSKREFEEEVNFTGNLVIEPQGIINDDSNDVGKVHVGFVFLLNGDSADISVKSELKSGELLSLEEMKPLYASMETWSQYVYNFLLTREQMLNVSRQVRQTAS